MKVLEQQENNLTRNNAVENTEIIYVGAHGKYTKNINYFNIPEDTYVYLFNSYRICE